MATTCVTTPAQRTGAAVPLWLYAALATVILAVYWIPRLMRGFWVDETGTYWIARGGFGDVWPQMQIYPGQSIVYAHLISLFVSNGPYKELLLRLPSVGGALVAAWVLYKLTERIAGQGTGFLAVIPFLCSGAIVENSTNARPYALGMAVMLGSFWSLREWVHTQSRKALAIYCLCSSLVVYFHYLFGIIFVVQLVYLAAARREGRRFSWSTVAGMATVVIVTAVPLVWQVLTIVQGAGNWKTSALPSLATFLSFYPIHSLFVMLTALVLFRVLHPKWFREFFWLAKDDTVLLGVWLLLGPIVVFAGSHATQLALFSTRYMIYALIPFFVLLAWAIGHVVNERARFVIVAAMAMNAALYIPSLSKTEWRTPLQVASEWAGAETPLLLRSGFVESAGMNLEGEPKASSYLFAPLAVYPVSNQIIPVPFYLDAKSVPALAAKALAYRKVCLVANSEADVFDALPESFRTQGYRSSTREVSGFTLMLFERI